MDRLVFDERLTRHMSGPLIVETQRGLVGDSGYWITRVTFSPSLFDNSVYLSESRDFAAAPFAQSRRTIDSQCAERMHGCYVAAAHAWTGQPVEQVLPSLAAEKSCRHSMTRPLGDKGFYDRWCTMCGAVRVNNARILQNDVWHCPERMRDQ